MRTLILGAGGHAGVLLDAALRQGELDVVGMLCGPDEGCDQLLGVPRLGAEWDLPDLIRDQAIEGVILGIGDAWLRCQAASRLMDKAPSLRFPSVIHPAAVIGANVTIGEGAAVFAGAVVNVNASLGGFSCINTMASVDHDSTVGRGCQLAPHAALAGRVRLGDHAVVSMGAMVIHRVSVGDHTLIGAGATVLHDLPAHVVAYGTPARVVRRRPEGEPFL